MLHDACFSVHAVAAAHQVCPYSNATRGNIDVVLTVNGTARRGRGQPSRPADTARALRRLVTELTTLAAAATATKRVTAGRRPAGVIALAAPAA